MTPKTSVDITKNPTNVGLLLVVTPLTVINVISSLHNVEKLQDVLSTQKTNLVL